MAWFMFPSDKLRLFFKMNPPDPKTAYQTAFNNNLTVHVNVDVFLKGKKRGHSIILIGGLSGTGKSRCGFAIAKIMQKATGIGVIPEECFDFDLGKYVFNEERKEWDWDFENYGNEEDRKKCLELFEAGKIKIAFNKSQMGFQIMVAKEDNLYRGATFILDEMPATSGIGTGSKRVSYELKDLLYEMRSMRMNFINISVDPEDVKAHWVFESMGRYDEEKGIAMHWVKFELDGDPVGTLKTKNPDGKALEVYEFLKWVNQGKKLSGVMPIKEDWQRWAKKIIKTFQWQTAWSEKAKKKAIEDNTGVKTEDEKKKIYGYAMEYDSENQTKKESKMKEFASELTKHHYWKELMKRKAKMRNAVIKSIFRDRLDGCEDDEPYDKIFEFARMQYILDEQNSELEKFKNEKPKRIGKEPISKDEELYKKVLRMSKAHPEWGARKISQSLKATEGKVKVRLTAIRKEDA